eukprot:TRINITY_DN5447_c0_g1_i3.p1 TRINITY_DN5447_c0_g1~~TRINITY_DN5447_c0_g1_i3.p1  ORF type:complete len:395 (+),score=67.95 TRINITY_DN5447_c0_g1_i3:66-1250(+)
MCIRDRSTWGTNLHPISSRELSLQATTTTTIIKPQALTTTLTTQMGSKVSNPKPKPTPSSAPSRPPNTRVVQPAPNPQSPSTQVANSPAQAVQKVTGPPPQPYPKPKPEKEYYDSSDSDEWDDDSSYVYYEEYYDAADPPPGYYEVKRPGTVGTQAYEKQLQDAINISLLDADKQNIEDEDEEELKKVIDQSVIDYKEKKDKDLLKPAMQPVKADDVLDHSRLEEGASIMGPDGVKMKPKPALPPVRVLRRPVAAPDVKVAHDDDATDQERRAFESVLKDLDEGVKELQDHNTLELPKSEMDPDKGRISTLEVSSRSSNSPKNLVAASEPLPQFKTGFQSVKDKVDESDNKDISSKPKKTLREIIADADDNYNIASSTDFNNKSQTSHQARQSL